MYSSLRVVSICQCFSPDYRDHSARQEFSGLPHPPLLLLFSMNSSVTNPGFFSPLLRLGGASSVLRRQKRSSTLMFYSSSSIRFLFLVAFRNLFSPLPYAPKDRIFAPPPVSRHKAFPLTFSASIPNKTFFFRPSLRLCSNFM